MDPGRRGHGRHRRGGGGGADADFVGTGLALVLSAASFLIIGMAGGNNTGAAFPEGDEWQVILALGLLSAGLLLVMYGMRVRDARPPGVVRRVAEAAGVVLWNAGAGGPERLLPLMFLLLMFPFEAWFDFF